jgi:hypothetical protein
MHSSLRPTAAPFCADGAVGALFKLCAPGSWWDAIACRAPPGLRSDVVCVQPDDVDWTIDYAAAGAPDPMSHPAARHSAYLWRDPDTGAQVRVRWNLPLMVPTPLFVALPHYGGGRDATPLRVWVDDAYHEIEPGSLVVMGPLLVAALRERGAWVHPRAVRAVVRATIVQPHLPFPPVLEALVAAYLWSHTTIAAAAVAPHTDRAYKTPPHPSVAWSYTRANMPTYGGASTLQVSVDTELELPGMLRPSVASGPSADFATCGTPKRSRVCGPESLA